MTLKEIAKYLKLSHIQIYKLAQQGLLPASKIGRVWRFEQSQIDQWLREGENTKKNLPFSKKVQAIIEDFVRELKKEFGKNLAQVIVFGSQARGDSVEGSDIDTLVVLQEVEEEWKISKKVSDIAFHVTFGKKIAVLLSTLVMDEREFITGGSPLHLNIRKEGKRAA